MEWVADWEIERLRKVDKNNYAGDHRQIKHMITR